MGGKGCIFAYSNIGGLARQKPDKNKDANTHSVRRDFVNKATEMKRLFTSALLGLAIILSGSVLAHAQLKWQHTTDSIIEVASLNNPDETDGIAIYSQQQSIIIKTDHRVDVRVFTILGQLVSHGEVLAGTSILNINSRGIYIVKIGNITQKVVL